MTRDTALGIIREACIKANPEIVKLDWGCQYRTFNRFLRVAESLMTPMDGSKDLYEYRNAEGRNFAVQIKEIIGRPIRLADVLLAIGGSPLHQASEFRVNGSRGIAEFKIWGIATDTFQGWFSWNLRADSLEEQSDEVLSFLGELLKQ